ncbi:hypothetical protein WBG78_11980 [Chryseolinea sp. T2]|uniref:hypothetical protein n=1 Tax=Chryseolinea sp. T2 TaxID=3129255 RepID=UPI003077DC23
MSMSTGGKLVLTVGIASSALLAAWLLTGGRRVKTREFVVKKAENLKDVLKVDRAVVQEDEAFYV